MMANVNEAKLKSWEAMFRGWTREQCYWFLLKDLEDLRSVAEASIACKRRIRKINKSDEEPPAENRVVRWDDDGSYIERVVLKATNMEDAEYEFKECHRIEYIDRGYDCTGQAFTSLHSIFNVGGKYVLYHWVSVDC